MAVKRPFYWEKTMWKVEKVEELWNEIFLNERFDVNDEHWDYIQNETVRRILNKHNCIDLNT